tara:strand:- start:598 stop:1113 length:516 start_codon:yes stop_codon:yes gene_type:complete
MKNRRYFIAAICCLYGILNTSCGLFHPPEREDGYLASHFYSCGPQALEIALYKYAAKNGITLKRAWNSKDISLEIQDDRKPIDLIEILVLFDKQASQITWPDEIKKVLNVRSIEIREITSTAELKDDIAIILVRKKGTLDTCHWIVYPHHDLMFYDDDTVMHQIFVLIPKS